MTTKDEAFESDVTKELLGAAKQYAESITPFKIDFPSFHAGWDAHAALTKDVIEAAEELKRCWDADAITVYGKGAINAMHKFLDALDHLAEQEGKQ